MLGRLRGVLRRPVDELAARPDALGRPLALVFALGVVAVAGSLVPGLVIVRERLPSLLPDSPSITLATGSEAVTVPSLLLQIMAFSLVAPFLGWLLTALVLHALAAVTAWVADGRRGEWSRPTGRPTRASLAAALGRYRRTLVVVGWGYAPQALASLVTAGLFLSTFLRRPDMALVGVVLTAAGHTVVNAPDLPWLTAATHAVGGLGVAWTASVWVAGLQVVRGLSRRTALAAALPLSLVVLYLSDLIGYLGLVG